MSGGRHAAKAGHTRKIGGAGNSPRLILGSASARRKRLLLEAGVRFEVLIPGDAGQPEAFYPDDPRRTACENAIGKNGICRTIRSDLPILTADTVVAFMGQCITKPQSRTHAAELLASFSAGTQQVLTAVAFQRPGLDLRCEVVESTVTFKRLTDRMISAYLDSVDPMDKAGAYDIGQHGDMIIASHTGSYTNIVGLPMELVTRWLREAGIL